MDQQDVLIGSWLRSDEVFLAGNPATTARDLALVNRLGFGWQKSLFQWRTIEGAGKGVFDWSGSRDLGRFVSLVARVGLRFFLRPGPWVHAESRNGGFPDWLLATG